MHKAERERKITGTGGMGKTAVMGLLERHGVNGHSKVKAKVVPNVRRKTLGAEIRQHVTEGSEVFTDALKSYADLSDAYTHAVIDHAECYAKGKVHTNGLENFWSLLKRSIKGTYVSVERSISSATWTNSLSGLAPASFRMACASLARQSASSASVSPTMP